MRCILCHPMWLKFLVRTITWHNPKKVFFLTTLHMASQIWKNTLLINMGLFWIVTRSKRKQQIKKVGVNIKGKIGR
jgi:hypothetical protein